jgi:hypothetical protein
VLGRFSRRTAVIEKAAEERGITNPDRKAELGAETREKKQHDLPSGLGRVAQPVRRNRRTVGSLA